MYRIQKVLLRKDYTTVVFSSGEFIRIPKAIAQQHSPEPGITIDEQLYSFFKECELREKMYFYVQQLVIRRFYSVYEVKTKLTKKYGQGEAVQVTLTRAVSTGLLDDYRFAEIFLRSLFSRNKYSLRTIKNKMSAKGISSVIQEQVMKASAEEHTDTEAVKKVVRKSLRHYSGRLTDEKEINKKVITAALRKGFNYAQVKQALHEISPEF